ISIDPALGFILYIAFGRNISKQYVRLKKDDKIIKSNILDTQVKLQSTSEIDSDIHQHKDMIYALANSNNAHYTNNNDVWIYAESSQFFNSLLEETLKKAKNI
ncbi:cardiolipin synthase, partial [Clostridioides difficile]